jgi:acid phosphatase class B
MVQFPGERSIAWQACPAIYDAIEKDIYSKKLASWWIANKDKNAQEIYRFIKGGTDTKTSSTSKTTVKMMGMDTPINYEGSERIETDYGYKTIFPTRKINTGEIVKDYTLPF